jgi:hypothetical protein
VTAAAITTAEAKLRLRGFITVVLPFDASTGLNPSHGATIALLTPRAMAPTPCDSPNRLLFRREIGGMKTDAVNPEGRLMDGGRVGRFSAFSGQPS